VIHDGRLVDPCAGTHMGDSTLYCDHFQESNSQFFVTLFPPISLYFVPASRFPFRPHLDDTALSISHQDKRQKNLMNETRTRK